MGDGLDHGRDDDAGKGHPCNQAESKREKRKGKGVLRTLDLNPSCRSCPMDDGSLNHDEPPIS